MSPREFGAATILNNCIGVSPIILFDFLARINPFIFFIKKCDETAMQQQTE